ncbi:MAG: TIGR01212 family radical SAM protein [Christensenellales bacterium]
MELNRYNHFNKYLKEIFGERTLKICVDGNFTCPNRDGKVGFGGCIFCGKMGAGELIKHRTLETLNSIQSQITGFLNSYRGERANKFIVYFQSFTNTYDTCENLKLKYDTALDCSNKIVGLAVATRPDCMDENIAKLLVSYLDRYYVSVELGLQTANDEIGRLINRGYNREDFVKAVNILHKYKIPVVAHIMVGLPNENTQDILDTVNLINSCQCEGVKIHSTYIVKNTQLEKMFIEGKYIPITQKYYIEQVGNIISHLNKDIIVHRINADPPKSEFVAPEWILHKKIVINDINKYLDTYNIFQGCENLTS